MTSPTARRCSWCSRGRARLTVGDESRILDLGGLALVPVNVAHRSENAGDGNIRILQVIAWLAAPRDEQVG
jgi:mannose-6-phosphate isomerase-like protein (cupin superfamily)